MWNAARLWPLLAAASMIQWKDLHVLAMVDTDLLRWNRQCPDPLGESEFGSSGRIYTVATVLNKNWMKNCIKMGITTDHQRQYTWQINVWLEGGVLMLKSDSFAARKDEQCRCQRHSLYSIQQGWWSKKYECAIP